MALTLTEEQKLLRETARQFFGQRAPVSALRRLRDTHDTLGFDPDVWKEMADIGFAGILVPEKYGGTDFGPVGLGLVLEQAGRTLAASPLISTALICSSAIQLGGTSAQRQKILTGIASGVHLMAFAFEEGAHHDPQHIELSALQDEDGYRLNGKKMFVIDGGAANTLIIAARTQGTATDKSGVTLFLVDARSYGLVSSRLSMADSRHAAHIELHDVEVPAANVLGSVGGGNDLMEQVLDIGRIGLACEMLGSAEALFDMTMAYLKERKQFGVPIGSFQALKHRAALMFIEIEQARSAVLEALTALEEKRHDVPILASLAKAKVSELSRLVTNECLQMHGGMGMTDQFDVGLFMKRARVAAATFGDSEYHRDRYATLNGY